MKKVKLDPEQLIIQSFPTTRDSDPLRGTVRGNSGCCYSGADCTEYWSTCDTDSELQCDTEYFCGGTGMQSCGCSNEPETCAAPCAVSDMTDCHRC